MTTNMARTQGDDHARRPYRMAARQAAADATTDRILDVARPRFAALPFDQVTLADVAAEAGVGVQTVLRRFATKEELLIGVADRRSLEIRAVRDAAPAGDAAGAVRGLVDTYERTGDEILALLAQENRNPSIASVVQRGRDYHHGWVERIWASALDGLPPRRRIRLAELVAATDLYTWKIYRRDLGLDRNTTEATMVDLCAAIVSRR
jgi:AcrR family transcriptional regulator